MSINLNFFSRSAQTGGESSLFKSDVRLPEWVCVVAYTVIFTPFWTNPVIYVLSNKNYRIAYRYGDHLITKKQRCLFLYIDAKMA